MAEEIVRAAVPFLAYLATQKVAGAHLAVAVTCASGEFEKKATSWNHVLGGNRWRSLIKLPLVRSKAAQSGYLEPQECTFLRAVVGVNSRVEANRLWALAHGLRLNLPSATVCSGWAHIVTAWRELGIKLTIWDVDHIIRETKGCESLTGLAGKLHADKTVAP